MSLQHLNLDAVSESDLMHLVDGGIPESKIIEYKQALIYATDEQKREFLSDLTAFANTDGGDLVFGIAEDQGVAGEVVGLNNFVQDDALGKIENLLRDFVQPRILGVTMRVIPLGSGKHSLVIRIPRSFSAPHMVRHQGVTRFCGRNANGKYDLDVSELRSAFVANETYADRLRTFRINRIGKLCNGEYPAPLAGKHLIVLHILPVDGVRREGRLQTTDLVRASKEYRLKPINSSGWGDVFDFDGLLVKSSGADGKVDSYVQLTRKGFIEAVESQMLEPRQLTVDGPPAKIVPSVEWERGILQAFPGYLNALTELEIPLPYSLSLSLLNVRGFLMYVGGFNRPYYDQLIDRDHLLTEEILIESLSISHSTMLRPLFDQVWNACGRGGSINYDEDGNWRAHR